MPSSFIPLVAVRVMLHAAGRHEVNPFAKVLFGLIEMELIYSKACNTDDESNSLMTQHPERSKEESHLVPESDEEKVQKGR